MEDVSDFKKMNLKEMVSYLSRSRKSRGTIKYTGFVMSFFTMKNGACLLILAFVSHSYGKIWGIQ